ncbi:MAG: hypothetical protein WCG94_06490, partial [Methanothrix sp.]
YKRLRFNIQVAATEEWTEEQQKGHDERLAEGKAKIIDSLELLNKAKGRAQYLIDLELGSLYKLADGKEQNLSLASAALYWEQGQRMTCDIIRAELALQGEDPASRIEAAIAEFEETRLDLLEAVDDDPEAKEKFTQILLERRRRNSLQHESGHLGKGGPEPQPGPLAEGANQEPG